MGLLKTWRPMPVATLAEIMRKAAQRSDHFAIWESGEMWQQVR